MIIVMQTGTQRGFVALLAAVLLSVILLFVTVSLTESGWSIRYNVLANEMKQMSKRVAESCINMTLLTLLTNPEYVGDETTIISGGECNIAPLSRNADTNQVTIHVTGKVANVGTTLTYVYAMNDIYMLSKADEATKIILNPNLLPTLVGRFEK